MKRPAPWQARRIATAKALRALPVCATPGCNGKAMGSVWGAVDAELCALCRIKQLNAQRAQREKRT